jgi:hypothetical protein
MIVLTYHDPVLVDSEALALITRRSVNTIRLRCAVVRYHGSGRRLYALHDEVQRLAAIPIRQRQG